MKPKLRMGVPREFSLMGGMNIRVFILLPLCLFASCSNPGKKAEQDRRNIYFAEFYYEQGLPARSLSHAQKIKPESPHYAAAQEWISRVNETSEEAW